MELIQLFVINLWYLQKSVIYQFVLEPTLWTYVAAACNITKELAEEKTMEENKPEEKNKIDLKEKQPKKPMEEN